MQGALGVLISATRELLNKAIAAHCTMSMNVVEALCACSTVLYANMQFMELIKLILASTCIIFTKSHPVDS